MRFAEQSMSKKKVTIAVAIFVCLVGIIFFLRAHPQYDVGGYKLPTSESVKWSTTNSPQPDFSNDDSWNESYLWAYESSHRMCRGDLAEYNPDELNGSRYSAVGSTMATAPQMLLSCIVPVPQKSLMLLISNLMLAGIGMALLIRLLWRRVPAWVGFAFAFTGPMVIYGAWPHSTSFAWIPLCIYTSCVVFLKERNTKTLFAALASQTCLLLSGQPEITLFGFALVYLTLFALFIAQRTNLLLTLKSFLVQGAVSMFAGLLSAWALIPIGQNALGSAAAEARGKVSWVSPRVEWELFKDSIPSLIFQFLDPGVHSSANTYRTAITPMPFSRLTAWVGFISLCLIVATLIWARRSKLSHEATSTISDAACISFIRFMTSAGVISCFISLRTHWSEALCSRLPLVSSMDRNLFRYLTVFFLFVAALACCQLVTKKIVITTCVLFVASRLVVFAYLLRVSKNLGPATQQFRDNVALSYSTLTLQRWCIVVLSIGAVILLIWSIRTKSDSMLRTIVVVAIFLEMVQVLVIRPHNWVEARPSQTAREVSNIVNDSGQRLVAPGSYFATMGTWLDTPMPTGYSLISEEQDKYLSVLRQCVGKNEYIFFSCSYDSRDRNFYDISNVGWVIVSSSLDDVDPRYHKSLVKEKTLESGYSLYRRAGEPSAIFEVDPKYCEKRRSQTIDKLDITPIKSEMVKNSDEDMLTFRSYEKLPRCSLLSLSFDEGLHVSGSRKLTTRSLGGFLLVDTSTATETTLDVQFESPGRSVGKKISFLSVLAIGVGWSGYVLWRRKSSRNAQTK